MPRGGPTPDHERLARDAPVAMPLIDGTAGDDAGGDAATSGRLPPLVVDVDGSLVSGDLLIEGVARMLAVAPWSCRRSPSGSPEAVRPSSAGSRGRRRCRRRRSP